MCGKLPLASRRLPQPDHGAAVRNARYRLGFARGRAMHECAATNTHPPRPDLGRGGCAGG
ncbi:hypothetical protein DN490_23285 [Burkholderia multivorans]|nr:hypothetical protein DN490_23285 [Burkholderia multivorans]